MMWPALLIRSTSILCSALRDFISSELDTSTGLVPVIEAARDCKFVTKISLNIVTPLRPGKPHLKFTPTAGGLKMQVRGNNAVQIFYLYTTECEAVIAEIRKKCPSFEI